MSAANKKWIKWPQVAGISLICGIAVSGCSRSDDAEDSTETADATIEQPITNDSAVAPAISCDDPMVQDRLKNALSNTLNQQAQTLAASYANEAEISLNSATVSSKVNGILIDVQNAAILQEANDNGLTTCQASVSMTLPSEDLYQASQVQAENNQPSLQTRLAQDNIRINNNMLVDDTFTYVVGTQGGQVRIRIAGQPALITVVSDVMAGSVLKSSMDSQRAQRSAEEATRRREAAQNSNESQTIRQPKPATPSAPAQPATPPTINQGNNTSATQNAVTPSTEAKIPATPAAPASVPKDESIDMVIIEDESATY
jgi:sRNA-binding protein